MADTKTHDETPITPLDGTEEVYVAGSAGTVDGKTTTAAIAGVPPVAVPITTGASPTIADGMVEYYEITSGGTAGTEIITLPRFAATVGGATAPNRSGRRITFTLAHQTDPADLINIQANGSNSCSVYPFSVGALNNFGLDTANGITLSYEGGCVTFIWASDTWFVDASLADGDFDVTGVTGLNLPTKTTASFPTSDPHVSGQLWNNLGVVTVSAG